MGSVLFFFTSLGLIIHCLLDQRFLMHRMKEVRYWKIEISLNFCMFSPVNCSLSQDLILGASVPSLVKQTFIIWNNKLHRRKHMFCPGWLAQLVGASSCEFDSWTRQTPRLWIWSLFWAHMGGNQSMFLSRIEVSHIDVSLSPFIFH